MIHVVKMPEIGQTINEGKVEEWTVEIGDDVEKGQEILLVESDKAVIEVISDVDGNLSKKLVQVGDDVQSGQSVAEIEVS